MKKTIIRLNLNYANDATSKSFSETGLPDLGLQHIEEKVAEEIFKAGLADQALAFKELTIDLLVESAGEAHPNLSDEQARAVKELLAQRHNKPLTVSKVTVKSLGISTL